MDSHIFAIYVFGRPHKSERGEGIRRIGVNKGSWKRGGTDDRAATIEITLETSFL